MKCGRACSIPACRGRRLIEETTVTDNVRQSNALQAGEIRTCDLSVAIRPIFNQDAVKIDMAAQVQITAAFWQVAPSARAEYAQTQVKAARASQEADAARAWGEGGAHRVQRFQGVS